MNIAMVGAGAMGCLFATLLSPCHRITLYDVARVTVDSINMRGIRVGEADGSSEVFRIPAKQSGQDTEKKDLVILFVKASATRTALAENRVLLGDDTLLLSLQNGMGNEEILEEFVPREKILLGTTRHNSVTTAPAEIFHSGAGVTAIGSPAGDQAAALRVVDAFRVAGIETVFSPDTKRLLWEKLFVNMTVNPITALLDKKIGFIAENAFARELTRVLISEAVEVARADGEDFSAEERFATVIRTAETISEGRASMCQDMEEGRPTEIDSINGAVIRLGEKYHIPTVTHSAITRLIHAKEEIASKSR